MLALPPYMVYQVVNCMRGNGMRNLLLFSLLFVCSCAPQTQRVELNTRFDVEQAESMLKDGKNTIIGNAFLRKAGGGVVTCAGSDVYLIPATQYAEDRMMILYGNTSGGLSDKDVVFVPYNAEYRKLDKQETCDSQGNFTFERISDGDFFVVTRVVWMVDRYTPQGGYLMKKVKVSGGETKKIVITH